MPRRIWDTFLWWDEADMLRMHLEEMAGAVHKVILCEARTTFGGDPKPLLYDPAEYPQWADKIIHVVADIPRTDNPWVREFAQRDAAWGALIDAGAKLEDVVIIGDVDEILSPSALKWSGWPVTTFQMRTALYAVDWLVPDWHKTTPMTVMATVRWLKSRGGKLAEVRQARFGYPVTQNGGWHFSWLGGPEKQTVKMKTGSSHSAEIMASAEAALICSGARWRDGAAGPGVPVEPATVDGSWPAMIRERRCPEVWFRPADGHWTRPAADDPVEVRDYLWQDHKPGKLAFEVGANQGQSLPRMIERYGRVIAFEPYPPNYRIAAHILEADVRCAAVSDHDGEITLKVVQGQLVSEGHESWDRLHLADCEDITIPCVTLDTVMAAEGVPAFVNMDVEGHELDVLRGASRLLQQRRTSWLIEFHSQDQLDGCVKILRDFGYEVVIVRHPHYAPGSQFYDQHGWLKAVPSAQG